MKQSKTKVIGITGGIGSGKSTVMDMLHRKYGAGIIVADRLGHLSMEKDTATYFRMIEEFGEDILDNDRNIDKNRLSEILLASEEKLKIQNSIVHPFVINLIKAKIEDYKEEGKNIVAVESAILFETDCDKLCDEVWLVTADTGVRIERLASDRGYTYDKAEAFICRKKSDDFFIKRCSKVIYNNGDIENLSKQLEKCIED